MTLARDQKKAARDRFPTLRDRNPAREESTDVKKTASETFGIADLFRNRPRPVFFFRENTLELTSWL
jgi:hypothetical protein